MTRKKSSKKKKKKAARKLSADALQEVIQAGDVEGCLALFEGSTASERRPFAKIARAPLDRYWKLGWDERREKDKGILQAAAVAVLATATLGELKKLGWQGVPDAEHAFALISALKPEWTSSWAELILEDNPRHWPLVRRLVRADLCPVPGTDNYILGMIETVGRGGHRGRDTPPLAERLMKSDPSLLTNEVWRMFEVEGGGEFGLAAHDKYTHPDYGWERALLTLSEEGHLSRSRLLDSSLDALERDFAQFRAGWFSRFHVALKPTVEERASRAGRYLGLLSSGISPTVSFALKALVALDKAKRLPARGLCEQVTPVLSARAKSTVTQGLRLLASAAKQEPNLKSLATRTAVHGLAHEDPDVQKRVFDFLDKAGDPEDAALISGVADYSSGVAASLRKRLEKWGAKSEAKPRSMDACVPAVLWTSPLDASRLIAPLETFDEVVDQFAFVLDNPGETAELERVLDGLSGLADQEPAEFSKRLAPLRKRAQTILKRGTEDPVCLVMALLAVSWSGRELVEFECPWVLADVFLERAKALAARVVNRRALPLLSAPTHRRTWIEPAALVSRYKTWLKAGEPLDPWDASLALLRLAPEGRAAALKKTTNKKTEFAQALRYALGGKAVIGQDAPLWVAAARARAPQQNDPALEKRHPNLGPDAGVASVMTHSVSLKHGFNWLDVESEPPPPSDLDPRLLSVLFHASRRWHSKEESHCVAGRNRSAVRWAGTIWPSCLESYFAEGAERIDLTWSEAQWEVSAYLEPLLDPDVEFGPMALLLLALALGSKEAGQKGLAAEILIAGVDDQRIDPAALGGCMGTLLPTGLVMAARWAATLGDVARVSTRHGLAVSSTAQYLLRGDSAKAPRDLGKLLQLLHELLIQFDQRVEDEETRGYLKTMKRGGKAGKLAKAILEL